MLISGGFDRTQAEIKAEEYRKRLAKGQHLANRVRLFIKDLDKNKLLTTEQKRAIKNEIAMAAN